MFCSTGHQEEGPKMKDNRATSMLMVTALTLALAAMLAGPASARPILDETTAAPISTPTFDDKASLYKGDGLSTSPAVVIPYVSQGVGVDESLFAGTVTPTVVPYLSHGVGVDETLFAGAPSAATQILDTTTPASDDAWYEFSVLGIVGAAGLMAVLLASVGTLAIRSRQGRAALS
jgi:hypothetical protein